MQDRLTMYAQQARYRAENREAVLERKRVYYRKNREKMRAYGKEYRRRNLFRVIAAQKRYRARHREKVLAAQRKHEAINRRKILIRKKNYRDRAANVRRLYAIAYRQRPEVRFARTERYRNDTQFKLAMALRGRLLKALKGKKKTASAVRDLGCTIAELRLHLERQFKDGMTWANHSLTGWHIDHIIPLSSVDLTNREQSLVVCHYINLRPMWSKENISKGNKII